MTDANHAGISPAAVETIAGLSAGSMATLIVHPLDIAKTRMQIHRSTTSGTSPLRTVDVIRSLLRTQHPVAALYRGLTPNLVGNASSWASFFFFKSRIERAIASLKAGNADDDNAAAARLTPTDFFLSSGLAGAATQVLTNPVWVLKTRMLSSDRTAEGAYPGMWAGAKRLLREEGFRGFYRGLGVGLLGVAHGAVQFAVYEPAKRVYFARRRRRRDGAVVVSALQSRRQGDGDGNGSIRTGPSATPSAAGGIPQERLTNEATLVLSTLSKLAAGVTTYPLQVLRSRLQNYDAEERFGRGIRGVAARLWREEGWRGFYRGLMPGVVRVLPATWVTFLVYENVRYYLPRWLG